MPDTPSAFIFPAFASDYLDHPGQFLHGFGEQFDRFLKTGAAAADPGLSTFSFSGPTFLADELRTQYMTYIYSCAVSTVLRNDGYRPVVTAGYSMGIYAALFDAGSISFENGLELIRLAYDSLRASLGQDSFGMATVIGLDREDITAIKTTHKLLLEITNRNAPHSFVVSGRGADVTGFLEMAREEGALHARNLGVSIPYHSPLLKAGAGQFASRIGHVGFDDPANPVISLVDQQLLLTGTDMKREVVRNLHRPLDWFATQQVMATIPVELFIESGPSRGLVKNARFTGGNYRFSSPDSLLCQ